MPYLDTPENERAPRLLDAFGLRHPAARAIIERSPEIVHFLRMASSLGVHYAGSVESSPFPDFGRAFTSGTTVYTPAAEKDPVMQVQDLLFEVSNALQAASVGEAQNDARNGTIDAATFADRILRVEARSTLQTGLLWTYLAPTLPATPRNAADAQRQGYFLSLYFGFASCRHSFDDFVESSGNQVYPSGDGAGLSVRQYYMRNYEQIRQASTPP